mmetsp:Transcript_18481/g.39854  ORF Transcript_18481/g.39854 Transcript_18481/m.39854 type:complete len:787 (-) Transcript_18481:191-2551(-)
MVGEEVLDETEQSMVERVQQGVRAQHVISHLETEVNEDLSCRSLPGAFLLFGCFMVSCLLADESTLNFSTRSLLNEILTEDANFAYIPGSQFQHDLGADQDVGMKVLDNANTRQDVHSWFRLGFFPLFQGSFATDDPADTSAIVTQWEYNAAIGGVRLSQELAPVEDCRDPGLAKALANFDSCSPAFYFRSTPLSPHLPDILAREVKADNPVRWFFFSEDWATIEARIDATLRPNSTWLQRRRGESVRAAVPLYNPELHTITVVYAEFFFARSGKQWARVLAPTLKLQVYYKLAHIVADVICLLSVLRIFYIEGKELYTIIVEAKQNEMARLHTLLQHFTQFCNAVDELCAVGFAVLVYFWVQHIQNTETLSEMLEGGAFSRRVMTGSEAEKEEALGALLDHVEMSLRHQITVGYIRSICLFLVPLRMFKAFSAQARLSILTRTFAVCAVELFHFLLVFFTLFMTWAVAGIVLFGNSIEEFADFERAMNTCLRVVLGEIVWYEVREEAGPIVAALWLWTFCFVNSLVVLNMLLAIIMDAYSEVKSSVGTHSETLPEQAWETFTHWKARRAGQRLSVREILHALEAKHLGGEILITPASFCKLVAGLSPKQAEEVLIGSLQDADDLQRSAHSVSGVITMVGAVDTRVQATHRNLSRLFGHSVASSTGAESGPVTSESVLDAVAALTEAFREGQQNTRQRLDKMEEYMRLVSDPEGLAISGLGSSVLTTSGLGVGHRAFVKSRTKSRGEAGAKVRKLANATAAKLGGPSNAQLTQGLNPCSPVMWFES